MDGGEDGEIATDGTGGDGGHLVSHVRPLGHKDPRNRSSTGTSREHVQEDDGDETPVEAGRTGGEAVGVGLGEKKQGQEKGAQGHLEIVNIV